MFSDKEVDLSDCILARDWSHAKQLINDRPESVYSSSNPFLESDEGDEEHEHWRVRPLHEIIRICCRDNNDLESSDTEDEDEDHEDEAESNEFDLNNEAVKSKQLFPNLYEKENMHDLARLMIQTSHNQILKSKTDLPSILSVTEGSGETPLHVVCSHEIDFQIVHIILENTRNRIARHQVRTNTLQLCGVSAMGGRIHRRHSNGSENSSEFDEDADANVNVVIDESSGEAAFVDTLIPSAIELITQKNSRGSTPLHYLSGSRHAKPSTLQYVLEACRKELEEISQKENSVTVDCDWKRKPNIANNRSDAKKTKKRVACGLEQILMARDEDHETPLHWACSAQADPNIISLLIEYGATRTLLCPNSSGECPVDMLAREYEENAEWINQTEHDVWDIWKTYMLAIQYSSSHLADPAATAADTSAIPTDAVPFESPSLSPLSATTLPHAPSYYPLHPAAASAQIPTNIASSGSQDKRQQLPQEPEWLPIHEMVGSSKFVCPLYFLDIGLRLQDQDLTRYNSEGMLPLHLALKATKLLSKNRASADIAAVCEGKDDDDSDGDIISQRVKKTSNGSINEMIIFRILTKEIDAAKMASLDGRRPIHHAVESQNGLSVIHALLKKYPDKTTPFSRDPVTGLHPAMLAAVDDNNSVDVVFELLRMCPDCICNACVFD